MEYIERAAPYSEYARSQKAYHLREGIGCEFDFEKYLDFLKEGFDTGDNMRAVGLANFYIKYGKYDEAMKVYDSIENLTPDINYQIGMLYRNGVLTNPPKPDFMQAAYYLRNAADENHIMAAYEYGMLCFRPTGRFRKDFRSAEKYLKIAADGGLADAQYVLGFMYKSGHVTRDLPKAVEYFEKARAQGHSFSAMELVSVYQQPEVQNYQRAFECATMAAEHGLGEGEFHLANLLFLGRGCESNINKAYELYGRAYSHGIHYASTMIARIDKLKKEKHI
jgi:TPR repeat protein